MSDDRDLIAFTDLVDGFTTDALDEGDRVVAIFGLVKIRDADGDVQWAGRSGGEPMSSEELLGALSGLVASIQRDLASDWEW